MLPQYQDVSLSEMSICVFWIEISARLAFQFSILTVISKPWG